MKPEFLYEVSWEVCNKVGGIYAVLTSKAAQMLAHYGDDYVLIGPYFSMEKLTGEFEELPMPQLYHQAGNALASKNIRLHWGKWLIPGSPHVLLVDFVDKLGQADEVKNQLWEHYHIDSWQSGDDITHPFVWAWTVGNVLQAIADVAQSKAIVAHFHEWLAGAGLLYLKTVNSSIHTVFTTHATVLGRALAEAGAPLYDNIESIDAKQEAYRLGVAAKHLTEKAAMVEATMASTVSNITALEVRNFLGRPPDSVLPNGLDISKYPTLEEIALRHRAERDRMREFMLYYFLPYYDCDVEKSLSYFISGRYEVKNKGLDVFINALGKLNEMLKRDPLSKTVVAFLFIPSGVRGIQQEVIENREWFRDMERSLEVHDAFLSNIMYHALMDKPLSIEALFGPDRARVFEAKKKKFRRKGKPPVCTYELSDKNDAILRLLQEVKLTNDASDKVKVIYYPTYLNGGDGLLNMEYQEVVMGSHFGIFPSLYEPWGYTPLETAALGVASLTTDLAGFGEFVQSLQEKYSMTENKNKGIYVLSRKGKPYEDVVGDLAGIMHDYAGLSREDRVDNKVTAKSLAEHADWKELVNFYFSLHERAIK